MTCFLNLLFKFCLELEYDVLESYLTSGNFAVYFDRLFDLEERTSG